MGPLAQMGTHGRTATRLHRATSPVRDWRSGRLQAGLNGRALGSRERFQAGLALPGRACSNARGIAGVTGSCGCGSPGVTREMPNPKRVRPRRGNPSLALAVAELACAKDAGLLKPARDGQG